MEKVFCTGASGFICGNLLIELAHRNYQVYALDRYVTGRDTNRINVFDGNLNDHDKIRDLISMIKPDYVVHLAAIAPVAYSYDHYFEVIDTNFTATVNLAEVNRKYNPDLKQFLFAGTSEEYGNQEVFPICESAELRPNSPYAVSKVASDKYLQYMKDAYGFPITVLRPFNTYGRATNKNMVVERILSQIMSGTHEVRLGDPDAVRDFLYMSDHVNAYLQCLGNPKALGETINFCTGLGVSIRELSELCSDLTGYQGDIVWDTLPRRPLDIHTLIGNNQKAHSLLGWTPEVSLQGGLEKTVEAVKGEETWRIAMNTQGLS